MNITPPQSEPSLNNKIHTIQTNVHKYNISSKQAKKIKDVKLRGRSNIDLLQWTSRQYAQQNFNHTWLPDKVPRIDYQKVSCKEFIEKWERPNLPVVIRNCTSLWKAHKRWNLEKLLKRYSNQMFKVGEDDDGKAVYLKFKYYYQYLKSEGVNDDSPLYIFDSQFSTDPYFKYPKDKIPSKKRSRDEKFTKSCLLDDFELPKYFKVDLFRLTGGRRPPFRWFVLGPSRSGTTIHTDPLGTSAWNALLQGHKRWVLFPQHIPKQWVEPDFKPNDREAVTWFARVFPRFKFPFTVRSDLNIDDFHTDLSLGEAIGMVEVIQNPGEIIFVPGGWHHVVMNLDMTICITQNFCSPTNLEQVWLKTRFSRPKLANRLRRQINRLGDGHIVSGKFPEEYRMYSSDYYKDLVQNLVSLQYTPAIYTSSDRSESTSSDEMSDPGDLFE